MTQEGLFLSGKVQFHFLSVHLTDLFPSEKMSLFLWTVWEEMDVEEDGEGEGGRFLDSSIFYWRSRNRLGLLSMSFSPTTSFNRLLLLASLFLPPRLERGEP